MGASPFPLGFPKLNGFAIPVLTLRPSTTDPGSISPRFLDVVLSDILTAILQAIEPTTAAVLIGTVLAHVPA